MPAILDRAYVPKAKVAENLYGTEQSIFSLNATDISDPNEYCAPCSGVVPRPNSPGGDRSMMPLTGEEMYVSIPGSGTATLAEHDAMIASS